MDMPHCSDEGSPLRFAACSSTSPPIGGGAKTANVGFTAHFVDRGRGFQTGRIIRPWCAAAKAPACGNLSKNVARAKKEALA